MRRVAASRPRGYCRGNPEPVSNIDTPRTMRPTTHGRITATLILLAVASPLTAVRAQWGFPPNDPASWDVAATAKVLCSALFVSGRDEAEAKAHLAQYFIGRKRDSIVGYQIDRQRKLVRLTPAKGIPREAKFYGDQGCIIHQPGRDSIYFKPVRVTTSLPDASKMPWPMGDILPSTPLPSDIDTAKVRQAVDAAFANPQGLTAAFVVVHKGRIIGERYANGAHKDMQLESWSMGKSIFGTLIGVLLKDGAFRLEDPAPVPEWHKKPGDPRAKIRVMDLMRMSSGLRFSRGSPEDIPGYHDHDLGYSGAIDAYQFAVTREPQFEPNTFGRYRNVDPLTLGVLIRDAVRKRGEEYLTWPQRALFDKIGIRRQVLETDPYGNILLNGFDYGTARNWARIGLLYLNDGVWLGQRILPEGFVKFASSPAPAWKDSSYGGMVWVNAGGAWRNLPRDAFAFRGAGGQDVYVVPSRELVIVRMGHFPGARAGGVDLERAQQLLMEAIPPKASEQTTDTLRLEVGSSRVNGNVYEPHAARVRVYVGDNLVQEWTNELTHGDSAGRRVHHWVTKTVRSPTGVTNELRQTYDAQTLAPLGIWSQSSNGAFSRFAINGRDVTGTRRTPTDTAVQQVRMTLDRPGFVASASDLVPAAVGLRAGLVMIAPVWGPNMTASDPRIFSVLRDTVVNVEGTPVRSWKVEERRQADRSLVATWYLIDKKPYMVYGEVPLPNGQVRRMTEVEIPMSRP
jgi:CubicO group peptidase (beta-lactamase class C family)